MAFKIKIRYILVILLFAMSYSIVDCQQAIGYSQLKFNKFQFNPAYGGMESSLSITALNRNQWSSLQGRPVTQHVNAHLPFYMLNGALGIVLENENIGAFRQSQFGLSYNFVGETPYGLFSVGLRAGLHQYSIDGSSLTTPEGIYEGTTIDHADPLLVANVATGILPRFTLGVYYAGDIFEGGISVSDFTSSSARVGNFNLKQKMNVTGYLEMDVFINDFLNIYPSLFVQSDVTQTQATAQVYARIDRRYYAGLGVRGYSKNALDAIIITGGIQFSKHYRLTYSYDLSLNGIKNVNDGTHEFMLNYNLQKLIGQGVAPKIIYNPRFL